MHNRQIGGKYEIERKREKREGRGKQGKHRVCARAVSEHETMTMVRLETYYSDYGAIRSTLQSVRYQPVHRR